MLVDVSIPLGGYSYPGKCLVDKVLSYTVIFDICKSNMFESLIHLVSDLGHFFLTSTVRWLKVDYWDV